MSLRSAVILNKYFKYSCHCNENFNNALISHTSKTAKMVVHTIYTEVLKKQMKAFEADFNELISNMRTNHCIVDFFWFLIFS